MKTISVPSNVTVPCTALSTEVMNSGSPSTSVSFASSVAGSMISAVSSTAARVSSNATGGSLTAATSMVTVALPVPW